MPHIPTTAVESSNIERVGYDADRQTLRVVFHSGRGYDYEGVDEQTYAELVAAESKGKFVAARIKPLFGWRSVSPHELRCCGHEDPEDCDVYCAPRTEGPCCGPLEGEAAPVKCQACNGTGVGIDVGGEQVQCGWCRGTGFVPSDVEGVE